MLVQGVQDFLPDPLMERRKAKSCLKNALSIKNSETAGMEKMCVCACYVFVRQTVAGTFHLHSSSPFTLGKPWYLHTYKQPAMVFQHFGVFMPPRIGAIIKKVFN